ncbi:MAG: ABC transporter ATP-binding protein [Reyranella sp.]|uniref:ABC transporter ATP-binding protein n=1 Tax=Reyranella sp. TaxID=1929291 RepID=UPI003D0FD5A8
MAVVSLEGLSKRYGNHLAVDDVSFDVGDREVMGLLGPNGSGKTTILRTLTGYLRPTAGIVRVAGFDVVQEGRLARRRIGYVPEDAPLYPQMRVNEFLAFMGRLRGLDGQKLDVSLGLARKRLGLEDVGETIIGRLSRGYRQRVCLAQAVLHEPDLLVLDEPTNGLDPRQIIEFRTLIRSLAEHCAIVVSSHILAEIARLADRVAILLDGRLLAVRQVKASGSIRLRARTDLAPGIVSALRTAMAGVEIAEAPQAGGMVSLHVSTAEDGAVDQVIARLAAAGIGIVEMSEAGADLEETFLAVTSRKAFH